jgi:hypothetical protein
MVATLEILRHLARKVDSQAEGGLAKMLGINQTTLSSWRQPNKTLSNLQIANLIARTRDQAKQHTHRQAIKALVEFFPIDAVRVGTTKKQLAVFKTGEGAGKHRSSLHKSLCEAKSGLYIFYDTRGKALYAGQTKSQNIWKEMNHAFNRDRSTQVMVLVTHPTSNVVFRPAHEQVRQPRDRQLRLHDLAAYFSAYQVIPEMVDDLEALLVRAFPNDLLNFKMEKFGKADRAKKKAADKKNAASTKPATAKAVRPRSAGGPKAKGT